MDKDNLQAVKGMNDLLPQQMHRWHQVEATLRQVAWQYGYEEIRTPILEKTALFKQAIGAQTDIVEKEMYTFDDAAKVSLSMRPEATASTVRACNQHGLLYHQQQRLWYLGPMFRRERPQKGRYRQFHQFGVEAFGWPGPDIDAEIIRLGARICQQLGIAAEVSLQLNTLGSNAARQAYRDALHTYLSAYQGELDPDSQRRLAKNPLRILDSKVASTQQILEQAPSIMDFLETAAAQHFDHLCAALQQAGIAFELNSKLVRGLDYYTSTVFEWVSNRLGAQHAVCAGGRYDGLVEQHGGPQTPAIGFAIGLERLVELVAQVANQPSPECRYPQVYLLALSAAQTARASQLGESLRDANLHVVEHCGGGKIKNQMKRADQSGAALVIIIGDAEQARGEVSIKPLRAAKSQPETHSQQVNVRFEDVVCYCLTQLDAAGG